MLNSFMPTRFQFNSSALGAKSKLTYERDTLCYDSIHFMALFGYIELDKNNPLISSNK